MLKKHPLMPQITDTLMKILSTINSVSKKEMYTKRYENAYNNAVEKQKIFLRDIFYMISNPPKL